MPKRDAKWCLANSDRVKKAYKDKPDYYKQVCEHLKKFQGPRSEEFKKKISDAAKRRLSDPKRNSFYGKKHSEETKERMSEAAIKRNTPEYCAALREKIKKGHAASRRVKEFHKRMQAHWLDPIYREQRILKYFLKSPNVWYGAITDFQEGNKYCYKFNNSFKERVRAYFNNQCIVCGTPQDGRKLSVHHVYGKKDVCCNPDLRRLFVPLCLECHGNIKKNVQYWKEYLTKTIDEYYGGKCYFEREEFIQWRGVGVIDA